MKKIILLFGLCLSFIGVHAQQNDLSTLGCATVTTPDEEAILKQIIANGFPASKTTSGLDSIPITAHIVGDNNGAGYYSVDNLFHVICKMNDHFAATGFYFYIKWPLRYIKNTSYYIHNYNSGHQMMTQNNVGNTVNIYFVQDPSGACGYYTYGADAIAISKSCAGYGSTTVTHEVGHYMSLPHTFYGWENNNVPNNPELVTRGQGANCSNTGDYFCDTDADYLGYRWNCPYTGIKQDANGDFYKPDGTFYMSYSTDNCMNRFSNQQMGAMRGRLQQRSYLTASTPSFGTISDSSKSVYPIDTMYSNMKMLKWNKVDGADRYYVRMFPSFWPSNLLIDTLIADTTIMVKNTFNNNYPLIYTVAPVNGANVCMAHTSREGFVFSTSAASSISNWHSKSNSLQVVPNPIAQQNISVQINLDKATSVHYQLLSINGQLLFTGNKKLNAGMNLLDIDAKSLGAGIYFLKAQAEGWNQTEKVVIQ